ncbi:MAG: hypothetical protein LBR68_04140 [Lachnoclostridium sp.]|jgi:hypothetical protein|nr:hypothetical protein [Lachnoclostridium sp.]
MKLAGKYENANDFFEAAKRCGWERMWEQAKDGKISRENEPLLVPKMVNLSFACELYLKAIAEARKVNFGKIHILDKLFEKLAEEDKKALFDIWRENAGENIIDCDYTRKMFCNNLEAVSSVFIRFRYADEWAGSVVSLQSSFTLEQFAKLSPFCTARPGDRPPINDDFLMQFAISLKTYTEKLLGMTYNS